MKLGPNVSRLYQVVWGRSGRRRYWIGILASVVAYAGAPPLGLPVRWVRLGIAAVWILFVAVPRLHDLGLTGWLALIPSGLRTSASLTAIGWRDAFHPSVDLTRRVGVATTLAVGLVSIAMTVWLGVARGQHGANRFGPDPGGVPGADVAETFD